MLDWLFGRGGRQGVWTTNGAKWHERRERATAHKRGRFRGGSHAFAASWSKWLGRSGSCE